MKLELQDRVGDKIVATRKLKAAIKGKQGNVGMNHVEGTISRTDAVTKKKTNLQTKCSDMKVNFFSISVYCWVHAFLIRIVLRMLSLKCYIFLMFRMKCVV